MSRCQTVDSESNLLCHAGDTSTTLEGGWARHRAKSTTEALNRCVAAAVLGMAAR